MSNDLKYWLGLEKVTIFTGKDKDGNRYLTQFIRDYRALSGNTDINIGCNKCLNTYYDNFIKIIKSMSNTKTTKARIKPKYEGIQLKFGSKIFVTNKTLTDEQAVYLLKNHPHGEKLFDVFWDEKEDVMRHQRIDGEIQDIVTRYANMFGIFFDYFNEEQKESVKREEYLKSYKGKGDSGNGSYLRNFRSLSQNSLQINIPRSRQGSFKPITLELLNNQREQINELALLLYRKGLSTRDVSNVMKDFFGERISKDSISNMASSFSEIRKEWEKRQLDAYYKVIYCDALYTS